MAENPTQQAEAVRPRLVVTAGQRYYQWVRQNRAANDDQTRYMVEAYREENAALRAQLAALTDGGDRGH
jgi:hypothetical protein